MSITKVHVVIKCNVRTICGADNRYALACFFVADFICLDGKGIVTVFKPW
ncbi:MAG: hypothetical protein J6Q83_04770 [Clostridia bacterium]|nr:hypothetical protein [Clostridia bacterium]